MSQEQGRDVSEVSVKVREIVGKNDPDLVFKLRQFEDGLWNQAPELRKGSHCWKPFLAILGEHISGKDSDSDWQKKVVALIANNTDET
jgi:hypothetical protein